MTNNIGKEMQAVARHGFGPWIWSVLMLIGGGILISYWMTPTNETLRVLASVAVPVAAITYFAVVAAIATRKRAKNGSGKVIE